MKFTILNPEDFTPDELTLVKLLEVDPFFEKVIRDIRKKIDWPEDGLTVEIDENEKTRINGLDEEKDKRLDAMKFETDAPISLLLSTYHLPYSWWVVVNSIILLNTVIPPNKDDEWYKPVEVRYTGSLEAIKNKLAGRLDHPNQGKPHIEIHIREKMSFERLTKELKNIKPRLDKYLSYLPHLPEKLPENIDIMREILDLTKVVSYKEAGEKLEKKYGNRLTFSADYNTIQKYKKRMLQYVYNLPSNPYMKSYIEDEIIGKDK